jgi:tetratricopeptide (TPR) repeat protein
VSRFVTLIALWLSLSASSAGWAGSEDAILRNEAGSKLFRQGKVSEAITEFQKAVQEDTTYLPARVNLAHSYERLNRLEEAIQEYRGVIELEPRNFFAHNNLGVIYDKKGRYDEAIVEFEAALRSEPGNAMALKNLENAKKNQAIVKERQAQILRAEKEAQANPKDPRASYNAARLHASYGNRDLALQWLERALRQGYKEVTYVKSDPAFISLREDRDFQLLLLGK